VLISKDDSKLKYSLKDSSAVFHLAWKLNSEVFILISWDSEVWNQKIDFEDRNPKSIDFKLYWRIIVD